MMQPTARQPRSRQQQRMTTGNLVDPCRSNGAQPVVGRTAPWVAVTSVAVYPPSRAAQIFFSPR